MVYERKEWQIFVNTTFETLCTINSEFLDQLVNFNLLWNIMYLVAKSAWRSSRRCVSLKILFLMWKPKVRFLIKGLWWLMCIMGQLNPLLYFPKFLPYTSRCLKQPVPFSIVCYVLPMRSTGLISITFSPASCSCPVFCLVSYRHTHSIYTIFPPGAREGDMM
jgi:hypothetical protein